MEAIPKPKIFLMSKTPKTSLVFLVGFVGFWKKKHLGDSSCAADPAHAEGRKSGNDGKKDALKTADAVSSTLWEIFSMKSGTCSMLRL